MSERPLVHICEVCEKTAVMLPEQAFEEGWDYPPRMGSFGIISPRTCGECGIAGTLWMRVLMGGARNADLSDKERATLARILGEPESILPEEYS